MSRNVSPRNLLVFFGAFILFFSTVFPTSARAAADQCTWTGGGAGDNWGDAANWTGCDNGNIPQNGDTLIFTDNAAPTAVTFNNDLALTDVRQLVVGQNWDIDFNAAGTNFLLRELDVEVVESDKPSQIDFGGELTGMGGIDVEGPSTVTFGGASMELGLPASFIRVDARPDASVLFNTSNITLINDVVLTIEEGANITFSSGTTVDLNSHGFSFNFSPPLAIPVSGSIDVLGPMIGAGDITKNSFHTVNLGGNSSFTGQFRLNSGNLVLTHANALGAAGPGNETLIGSSGAVLLQPSITSFPEDLEVIGAGLGSQGAIQSFGPMTLTGNITLGASAMITSRSGLLQLPDDVVVDENGRLGFWFTDSGTTSSSFRFDSLTLDGATLVAFGAAPIPGTIYTVIENSTTAAVSGTFQGLPEGGSFIHEGVSSLISYVGGSGNDVTLEAVEDADWSLAIAESIDPVVAGSGQYNLVYRVSRVNNGPAASAASAQIELTLPAGVAYDGIYQGLGDGACPPAPTIFPPLPIVSTMPQNQPAGFESFICVYLTVGLEAPEGADAVGIDASITATSITDPDLANNTASDSTAVRWPSATFEVNKEYATGNGGPAEVGLACADGAGLLEYDPPSSTTPASLTVKRFDETANCSVEELTVPVGYYLEARSGECDVASVADQSSYTCTLTNAPTYATFEVTKTYSDGSDGEVSVTLSCNNGLPLEQSFTISDGKPVLFVLTAFTEGEVDCEITETGSREGYTPSYVNGSMFSEVSCAYEDVTSGEYICEITNSAKPASYTVTKEWVVSGAVGEEIFEQAWVDIECDSAILSINGELIMSAGNLRWRLDGSSDSVTVEVSTLQGPTFCSATEDVKQSGVETAYSASCTNAHLTAGGSGSCTITNTVFFEGIPTLSQWGTALMALLMLGVGFVGLRRFG